MDSQDELFPRGPALTTQYQATHPAVGLFWPTHCRLEPVADVVGDGPTGQTYLVTGSRLLDPSTLDDLLTPMQKTLRWCDLTSACMYYIHGCLGLCLRGAVKNTENGSEQPAWTSVDGTRHLTSRISESQRASRSRWTTRTHSSLTSGSSTVLARSDPVSMALCVGKMASRSALAVEPRKPSPSQRSLREGDYS